MLDLRDVQNSQADELAEEILERDEDCSDAGKSVLLLGLGYPR
jgi:hypothetical protein